MTTETTPPDGEEPHGAAGAAAPTEGAVHDAEAPEGDSPARPARRRRPLVIALGAAVLVLVGVLVALLIPRGSSDPITTITITETATIPTPPAEPVERDTSTDLTAALPGTVLGYAVSEQVPSERMAPLHPLEAWTLTYTGAESAVDVHVGQWPTGEEALEAYTALAAVPEGAEAGDPAEVVVEGDAVGEVQTQVLENGTERTVWRHGTVVLLATGPEGATAELYLAYPF